MNKKEYNIWDDHSYEKTSKLNIEHIAKGKGYEDYEGEYENMDNGRNVNSSKFNIQNIRKGNGCEGYEDDYEILDDESNVKSSRFNIQYIRKRNIGESNSKINENDENIEVKTMKKSGRKLKQKPNDRYTEYQYEDVVFFIEQVEQHTVLWDSSRTNSCRKETKRKLFDEIEASCAKFMPRGKNVHGTTAQKLWNDLKKDYVENNKKIQKAKSGVGKCDLHEFIFEKHLTFLDVALEKREVKTAYVFGCEDDSIIESEDDDFAVDDSVKPVMETPKRKLNALDKSTPKSRRRETQADLIMKKLEKSDEAIVKALEQVKDVSVCGSERICKTFQKHVENWPEVDRYLAECSVLQHIITLRMSGDESVPSNYQQHPHQQHRIRPQMHMQQQNHFHSQLQMSQHSNFFPNMSLEEASSSNHQNYHHRQIHDPFGDTLFDMNFN